MIFLKKISLFHLLCNSCIQHHTFIHYLANAVVEKTKASIPFCVCSVSMKTTFFFNSELVAAAFGNRGQLASKLRCGHSRWPCALTGLVIRAVTKCKMATGDGLSNAKG